MQIGETQGYKLVIGAEKFIQIPAFSPEYGQLFKLRTTTTAIKQQSWLFLNTNLVCLVTLLDQRYF